MKETIHIDNYNYHLPENSIASHPLQERDASRLLHYKKGNIYDRNFKELPSLIPEGSMMVFNNTRVVPARLLFVKESGALIEVFCLEPVLPTDYNLSFAQTESVVWRVMIGNKKRWKRGIIKLYNPLRQEIYTHLSLSATYEGQEGDTFNVRFSWQGGYNFSEVLAICGKTPIPPYLAREEEQEDKERYQTVYALWRGSVAAPTAGLHFTDNILSSLKDKNINISEVTLHVGAGTFMPVKTNDILLHEMHSEPFTVTRDFIERLCNQKGEVIAVGTTSARCLESLYYFGLMCYNGEEPRLLPQWEAYRLAPLLTKEAALEAILNYLQKHQMDFFSARTQIMIVPSFKFRFINGLITNFHQPKSTLLLLIAAFIGEDWRSCYVHAIQNDYRFLSYGDSSLLWAK